MSLRKRVLRVRAKRKALGASYQKNKKLRKAEKQALRIMRRKNRFFGV